LGFGFWVLGIGGSDYRLAIGAPPPIVSGSQEDAIPITDNR
jgi:hypothetical protein